MHYTRQQDKLEHPDFKHDNSNFKFQWNHTVTRYFWSQFKDFYFSTKYCNKANSRVLISNMTIGFQNCCPKHPNKAFLVPNIKILIFGLNFSFWKIHGYFKYEKIFFFFANFSLKILKYSNFGSKFRHYYFILLRLHDFWVHLLSRKEWY